MATVKKKKETRDEIIARVSKEYNITPKAPSTDTKGTIIASSKGASSTYKANRTAAEHKQNMQSIADKYRAQYVNTMKKNGAYDAKWYSGSTPTAAETMAQIFRQSSEDEGFFNKLNELFEEEIRDSGSIIYSPYREATNYKAIEGLRSLGVDVPDVITPDWIAGMQAQYSSLKRTTATGLNAAAPTKSSTDEQDIAYWLKELTDAEAKTSLAEAQLGDMYKEVEYLAKQGYSDSEILKRVRADFGKKYNVLEDMDEARKDYSSVVLNRAVDYNGDDTINGMIWAARNGGGSGSYFEDAVHHYLRQGNLYKPDPNSEAALDPSNYEGYAPYRGSTLHDLNMKYGVTEFNADWLEKNRGMLSDPEQAKDWRKVNDAVKNADLAATELGALDQWVEKKVADGETGEEIKAELDALLENGDELRYTDADGRRQTIKLTTLARMEEKRAEGDALALAYGVDFGVPAYMAKIDAMTSERDAVAVQVAAEEAAAKEKDTNIVTDIGMAVRDGWNWLMGEKGALNDVTEAQTIDTMTSMEAMAQAYARNVFGVEITGELKPHEEKVFKEVLGKANAAALPGASKEQVNEANVAAGVLQDLFTGIIADPERRVSEAVAEEPVFDYHDMEAYQTVLGDQKPEPREGMAEMVAEPTAFMASQPAEAESYAPAYEQMLQGGEWDGDAFSWALANSSNQAAVTAELKQGIIDILGGGEGNPLARSWYNKFAGLIANIGRPTDYADMDRYDMNPELFDSQRAYGADVYDALKANEAAFDAGMLEKSQFADNLVKIASVAEMIGKSTGGARATEEQAAEVLNSFNGSVGVYLADVKAGCDAAMDNLRANEEDARIAITNTMDAWIGGQQLDANQQEFIDAVMTADVSSVAKGDSGYQGISSQMQDALSVDSLLRSGKVFTTGNLETDMMMDHADLQQSGALAYGQGVMLVAQDLLDKEMRIASAYGMSLDEYYAAYPDRARTADQLRVEAEATYNEAWGEFGNTISGLLSVNENLQEPDSEAAKISTSDTLNIADIFDLATQKFCVESELAIEKTKNFVLWGWSDYDDSVDALRYQYGNDPAAYAADLDKWISEQPEDNKLAAEVKVAREANVDIFKVGKSIDELQNMQNISNLSGTAANIDRLVAENGSEADSLIYNGIQMVENSVTVMAGTAAGGGNYLASLLSTITNAGSNAYDRFQQSGNYMAAGWASLGTWLAEAAIEKMGFDRYIPESLGGKMESMLSHSQYVLAEKGLFNAIKNPKAMATLTKGLGAAVLKGVTDATSEAIEETAQALVSMLADNIVYGKPLVSLEQVVGAFKEGVTAAAMSPVFSFGSSAVYASTGGSVGGITFTDFHGNLLSEAEAKLLPEHDGAVMSAAIDFESTAIAIHKGREALAQIEASSENAAKKQASEALAAAKAEAANAETELTAAQEAESVAAVALEDANVEMQDGGVFTEDLRKRMTAAADAIQKAKQDTAKARERVQAASQKQAEAQKAYDEASAKVQAMYADMMGKIKAEAEQWVVDKFFSGDSEQKKAATQNYLTASKRLMEAKNNLRSAKADLDMYGRGTPRGENAYSAYGEALLEVDKLTEEVGVAKAEMEAAYAQTGEGKMEAAQNEELTTASLAAEQARAEAEADPMNAKKQAKAELEQSKLRTVKAKQSMDEKRHSISQHLNDPRSNVREQAVSEWNALQAEADAAAAESEALQAEYDKTDVQKRLQAAIDNFKQYDNIDLINEDSENHQAAVQAQTELLDAMQLIEVEAAQNSMSKALGEVSLMDVDTIKAYKTAKAEADAASDAVFASYPSSGLKFDKLYNYSSERRQTIVEYLGAVDEGLVAYYDNATSATPQKAKPYQMGTFTNNRAAEQVADDLGMDIVGWNIAINNDGCKHISNGHGIKGDADHSMSDVNDVARIAYVANTSDSARVNGATSAFKNSDGTLSKLIEFKKAVNGTYYVILAAPDTKKHTLNVISAYVNKKEAPAVPRSGSSSPQLYVQDGRQSASGSIVAEDGKPVNTQDWRNTGAGFGDHRGPAKTGEQTTADRNPIEILSDLTSSIRVGYNPGGEMSNAGRRVRQAVLGFYQQRAEAIKTRTSEAGDLAVGLHEFGHAVQARLSGLHANQQLIDALPRGVRNAYDPAEWDGEAIAEFVVDYIFNRNEAVRMAGQQFVQEFEDRLREDRPLYRAVMDASHQTELWNNADTGSKIGSMMKEGNDPRRGQIGNWLQRTARSIETAVADMTAPADMVSRDFRQRALYSLHARQRADVSLTKFLIDPNGRNIGQSLAERFYRAGVTEADQKEVSRFALARHALDRLAQNKPVFDEHEFPESELRAYVADVQANHPNIVAGADALTSFWNDYMDAWWVSTGMINQADVDHMRQMYPHYVPTFRVVGKNFNQYGGGSARFRMRGAVEGGSSLEVIDPLNSIVRMTQQMTSTVTQNQLMRDFHTEWRRGGLGFIAEDVTQTMRRQMTNTGALQASLDAINATGVVDPALMDDAYAEMLNLQERWYGTGQNYGANVVSGVDEYGNRFFYRIKDEGLYNLLSGTAGKSGNMGAVLSAIRNFKNMFTKLTTGSNPLFAAKNAMRDIQASVNTGTHSLTYADGMVRWLGALRDVLTNAELYQDWQAMGGGEHTRLDAGIDGRAGTSRDLSRALFRGRETRRGDFKTRSTAVENISNVFTWEKWNNAIEAASRYMEYKYGRHDLTTDEGRMEAFMRSQDVTTNFGTRGASKFIRFANQVVPFMNATIQGLNKDINIVRDLFSSDAAVRRQAAPKAAKTVMNTALTAMLQYGLLKMFGGKEDDEDYALLNQEMRMGNLIIPIPNDVINWLGDQIGFDKPYIRIPIAQGPLAQGMYAAALDTVSNVADYSPMEVELWSAVKSLLSDSIPDGTVFQGLIDAVNNRTWYGGEIESEYMRRYSEGNRYENDTPSLVIELANMLHVSPVKLNYLFEQYTGFAGKLAMPFISRDRLNMDEGWSLDGATKNLAYSILKNYTIDPASSNNLSASYSTAKDTISEIIADGKAGKPMFNVAYSADAYDALHAAEVLSKEFAALDKEISALWAEYNDIKASGLDDGEKSRQMRDIRRNYIIPLQQEALALYEEYKLQYIDADPLALEIYGDLPYGIEHPSID